MRSQCQGYNRFGEDCGNLALPGHCVCRVHLAQEDREVELLWGPCDGMVVKGVRPRTSCLERVQDGKCYLYFEQDPKVIQYLGNGLVECEAGPDRFKLGGIFEAIELDDRTAADLDACQTQRIP